MSCLTLDQVASPDREDISHEQKPYQLITGDCITEMAKMPSGSVDAIITDPPYGMDYQSARRTDKSKRFVKIVNDERPFIWWLPEAFRILRNDSALFCFCDWRNSEAFRSAIQLAGFTVKSQAIWDREAHGMGDLKSSLGPQHDIIWFAAKGRFTFPGKRPTSVFRSMRIAGSNLVHPDEKPVELLEQLITAVTRPGDTVIDPFMGSGSTGVAAVNTGRRVIGIDRDDKYVGIATARLEEAYAQTR